MQLRFIRRTTSDLARLLLQEARRRGLSTTFALASAIKVDPDSVVAILDGGRPNARTVQRYRAFLRLSSEQLLELKGNALPEQILTLVQPKQRAEQHPSALETTGIGPEIVALRKQLRDVVRTVAALGSVVAAVEQRIASLGDLADTLDADVELREFLAASSEARRYALHILRASRQRGGVAVDADAAPSGASSSAAQRKSRRIAKRA